ncbi:pheophytinase, chloroplastic-like [Lycium ferocissimum]|uniref:pheophytinase, chloroplastic-like n=1 Tax=Lycium ferocissimum TaxID=112874 RepID=UPI002815FEC4|nr:pheophytinase, chloroplastic-like [Lycium ferocissimum]XP_059293173.1 pheophytinase, chloroplastic-like [Lycium ferocissimum]
MTPSVVAESSQGLQQLPFKPEGYNYWTWRGYKIHYVEEGEGFPIVLIHGFASSSFHWRYNIPQLAKRYKVYAVDLLGFGCSEKARIDYDALIWRDQVVDFLKEIVKQPSVLVGNSLGGFTTLLAAAALPDQVKGVSLLNSAGRFGDDISTTDKTEETALHKFIVKPVEEIFQRVVVRLAFWLTMRPDHIEAQLKSCVYKNHSNVDEDLINSIVRPAADPYAWEVYYRLVKQLMSNPTKYTLDSVLSQLSCPLLLLWGDLDPLVLHDHDRTKANRITDFYPNTSLVNLQAGHYPQDEVPEPVNKALLDWLSTLDISAHSLEGASEI